MVDKKCKKDLDGSTFQAKEDFTKYSKPLPVFTIEDQKDKGEDSIMEHSKFRDYASDFWEKKRLNK